MGRLTGLTSAQIDVSRKAKEGCKLSDLSPYERQVAERLLKQGRIHSHVNAAGEWFLTS